MDHTSIISKISALSLLIREYPLSSGMMYRHQGIWFSSPPPIENAAERFSKRFIKRANFFCGIRSPGSKYDSNVKSKLMVMDRADMNPQAGRTYFVDNHPANLIFRINSKENARFGSRWLWNVVGTNTSHRKIRGERETISTHHDAVFHSGMAGTGRYHRRLVSQLAE